MDKRIKKDINRLQEKTKDNPLAVDNFVPALKNLMDQTEERQEDEGKFVNQSRHLNWFRTQTAKSYSGVVYDYTEEYEKHQAEKEAQQKAKAEQQKEAPVEHPQTEPTEPIEAESSNATQNQEQEPETSTAETVIDAEFSTDPHEQATQAIDASEFLKNIEDESGT